PTPARGPTGLAPTSITPTVAEPTGGQPGKKSRASDVPIRARVSVGSLPTLPHSLAVQLDEYRVADPDLHLDVVVPQLKRAPVLNRQLRQVADSSVRSFHRTVRREAGRGSGRYHAMSVGWQLLARSDTTTGIQLWVAQQHGLQVRIDRMTVWYDHRSDKILRLKDLFVPAAWPAAQHAILGALRPHSDRPADVEAALAARGRPDGNGPTFGFTVNGSLVVTMAGNPRSPPGQPASVRLAPGPLQSGLSQAGRSASSTVRTHQARHAGAGRVDCSIRKCVALTFDDGPGPYTAELVSILGQRNVPATFFLVGDRVQLAPDLVVTLAEAGLEIANHSSHHDDLTTLGAHQMERDLAAASRAITAVTGHRPTLLRPPYGSRNPTVDTVSTKLRMAEILWDVDTLDWLHPDPVHVRHAAVKPARRGSIILMHDIHRTTVAAVPQIITDLERRGYTLVTVTQLLHGTPQPGRVYRRRGESR
ncbi:MAG TPA: polysaccharide deacetylase family protein, partial [Propionibacteriaceae bacterium]|nr:polysaccharide deacetylase family protein [Propionibacteriaceae bacterium]